ncbi:hypothetical protein E6H22_08475 [Candidatus Bathyarchaeota archaeon]|nr:MAG: hypothetical protein E6H22_08475 [Candidatus Bathyarchaeota archaeon]
MRVGIVVSGIVILAVGVLYLLYSSSNPDYFQVAVFALPFGCLNLGFGILVDRGVIGSTIYVILFSDRKLALKRLTSGSVTVLAVVVFAVVGLLFAGFIGAAIGGLTAFSLQEFLTQRRRDATKMGNPLAASGKGDLEFAYADLERVQLAKSRLRLHLRNGIMGIVISRRYPEKMRPIMEGLVSPSKMAEPV